MADELLPLVEADRRSTPSTSRSAFDDTHLRPREDAELNAATDNSAEFSGSKVDGFAEAMRLKIVQKQRQKSSGGVSASTSLLPISSETQSWQKDSDYEVHSSDSILQSESESAMQNITQQRTSEYNRVKEDLLRSRRAIQVMTGADAAAMAKDVAEKELISPLEQRRQKYIKRKREFGDRSEETYEKLKKFTSAIRNSKSSSQPSAPVAEVESYHGQVLEKSENSDDDDLSNWNTGKLKFTKHIDDKFRNGQQLGGDGRSAVDYEVIDPKLIRSEAHRKSFNT